MTGDGSCWPVSGFDEAAALLEVAGDADDVTIRDAWRAAARRWHPDSAGGDSTRFDAVRAAHSLLLHPANPYRDGPVEHNPFETFDGPRRRGDDISVTLTLTLAQLLTGVDVAGVVNYVSGCGACRGTGCEQCAGSGTVTVERKLRFRLPGRTSTASTVTLPRRGAPGRGGGPSGDLHVLLTVTADRYWTLVDGHLGARVYATFSQLMYGHHMLVDHPRGTVVHIGWGPRQQPGFVVSAPGADVDGGPATVEVLLDFPDDTDRTRAALTALDGAHHPLAGHITPADNR